MNDSHAGPGMTRAFPNYIDELPEDQQGIARCRFLVRLSALYYSPEGKLNKLSKALDLHENSLATTDSISAEMAIKLETLLGRDLFPRELFRPDLFTVEG